MNWRPIILTPGQPTVGHTFVTTSPDPRPRRQVEDDDDEPLTQSPPRRDPLHGYAGTRRQDAAGFKVPKR